MSLQHLLFAFDGFASIGMLWWGILGGIPIMIHLLHKRKYRETSWAAMRFLLEAARKNSRRIRIEQLILLMVRVLILLLLACALAQPYMKSFGTFFQADAPTHRIIVVDASLSMAHQPAEFSRFDRARAAAREIVSASHQGDAINLVRIGELSPRVIVQKPAYQKNQVLREIDDLAQSHEMGDVLASLRDVEQLLKEAPDVKQKEVIFISDLQRSNWAPNSSSKRVRIRRLLQQIDSRANLSFLDVGQTSAANLAVTQFRAAEPFITVDRPVPLQARIINLGGTLVTRQLIEMHINGRLVQSRQIDLPPGEEVLVDFDYTFSAPGEHRLEVRLAGDALSIDNHRYLSLPVKEELSVLLVNGRTGGRPSETATYYIEKALRPRTRTQPWEGVTRPTVIGETELRGTDLSRYDCVILSNIGLFTPQGEAPLLKSYVESGGGLIICLGDQVQYQNYNQVLYDEGQGVLPVKLKPAVGNAEKPDPDAVFGFDPADLSHPIVNQYEGNPGTGLENTMVFRYFPVEIPPDSRVTEVLKFTNTEGGDPAILEAPFGQGRVILLTTAADNRWGVWPVQPQTSFLPILHESVRFAVAGRWSDRQKQVGQPISQVLRAFNVPVTVTRPDGQESAERPTESNNLVKVAYEKTDLSGVYELKVGAPANRTQWYAVNIDPRESGLSHVSEDELKTEVLPGVEFEYLTQWQDGPRRADTAGTDRGGLTRWLLLAVFSLVLVELLMAWQFHWGFGLLCLVVALVMVGQFFVQNAILTGVLLLAALGIAVALALRWRSRNPRLTPTLPGG